MMKGEQLDRVVHIERCIHHLVRKLERVRENKSELDYEYAPKAERDTREALKRSYQLFEEFTGMSNYDFNLDWIREYDK